MPKSRIQTLAGLRGHVLGVNADANVGYLLVASVLTENGITMSTAFSAHSAMFPRTDIPFNLRGQALAADQIDVPAASARPSPIRMSLSISCSEKPESKAREPGPFGPIPGRDLADVIPEVRLNDDDGTSLSLGRQRWGIVVVAALSRCVVPAGEEASQP